MDFGKYRIDNGMLRWREGDYWIVASKKFDVISQGPTLEEAWQRWTLAFALTMLHHIVEAPPVEVLKNWVVKHELCSVTLNHKWN